MDIVEATAVNFDCFICEWKVKGVTKYSNTKTWTSGVLGKYTDFPKLSVPKTNNTELHVPSLYKPLATQFKGQKSPNKSEL